MTLSMMSVSSPIIDSDRDLDRWWRGVRMGGASVTMGMTMIAMCTTMVDTSSASVSLDLDRGGRWSKKTCLEVDARVGGLRPG